VPARKRGEDFEEEEGAPEDRGSREMPSADASLEGLDPALLEGLGSGLLGGALLEGPLLEGLGSGLLGGALLEGPLLEGLGSGLLEGLGFGLLAF
jgi:hypothetical protein